MKTCTKCGCEQPLDRFSRNKRTKDGLQQHCKGCNSAHYKADAERIIARVMAATNPDAAREKARKWYANNTERAKVSQKAWRTSNTEVRRVHHQNRRAIKRECGGKLSVGLDARLFKLQRGKCACGCKQPLGDDYHRDHIMPLALGGSNTDDNIQLLRSTCNLQKSAKHPIDFMRQRGFLL